MATENPNRSDRGTVGNRLSEQERQLLRHTTMWGSRDWMIRRLGSRWTWEACGITAPQLYRTKRECYAAFDRFEDVLVAACGQEAYERVAGLS